MYNCLINITTGNTTWKCLENELQNKLVRIISVQKNRSHSMDSPICAVTELTKIVRVVGDHDSIKVKFSFIHESITEMALLIYLYQVSCVRDVFHMPSKYRPSTNQTMYATLIKCAMVSLVSMRILLNSFIVTVTGFLHQKTLELKV